LNDDVEISLRAEVSASEDPDKVLVAARNILGDCTYEVEQRPNSVTLRSTGLGCLRKVRDQLRDRHVRNAARRQILKGIEGSKLRVLFNRQAAYVDVIATISAGEESPLGPLVLELTCDQPLEMLDWLTPYQSAEPQ
jgi:predicted RNA binding protein with dsRBD fold (UPF0201 family)